MPVNSVSQTILPPSAPLHNNPAAVGGGFGDILKDALAGMTGTDAAVKGLTLDAITGGDVDLHNIAIAAAKAELTLNLTLQLRNKIIDSYTEIMRMSV
jgi:flagellar hook-basal body complex protein FliE